ncbi:MAG TPA: hypothetical protein P5096_00485 [Patescibacteria group bacterium]|nr:hypothetical protein [Patescibacteria group bacterium]
MSELIFQRIIRLLSSGEFEIAISNRTGKEAGYIDYENDIIYINPRIFPAEETLIHEALHILKPDLDENTIIEISSLLYEKLNNSKRDRLVAYIKALATKYTGFTQKDLRPTYV